MVCRRWVLVILWLSLIHAPVHAAMPTGKQVAIGLTIGGVGLASYLIYKHATYRDPILQAEALCAACATGDLGKATVLLQEGAAADGCSSSGATPLMVASVKGQLPLVQLLLKSGASPSFCGRSDISPLVLAVGLSVSSPEIVQALLDAGAEVNAACGNMHRTALDALALSPNAFNDRWLDVVRLLIKRGADVNHKDASGCTPLLYAASFGNVRLVQLLVELGADVHACSDKGSNAIWFAAGTQGLVTGEQAQVEEDCAKIIQFLYDRGVPIDNTGAGSEKPLLVATAAGNKIIVKKLLELKAQVDSCDESGHSALAVAVIKNNIDLISTLIAAGANKQWRGDTGQTLMHIAAFQGSVAAAELLWSMGVPLEDGDNDGYTPLHVAAFRKKIGMVNFLVSHGANPCAMAKDGNHPMHNAAATGSCGIIQFFLDHGEVVDCQSTDGATSLHYAAQGGHVDAVSYLLDSGAPIDAVMPKNEFTPLCCAAIHDQKWVAKLLLQRGADVKRFVGDTPLLLFLENKFGIDFVRENSTMLASTSA